VERTSKHKSLPIPEGGDDERGAGASSTFCYYCQLPFKK
jgi:hypothetical protein